MRTPYTTRSGVRIGQLYAPPPERMSDDAIVIQRAFIDRVADSGHTAATWIGAVILCASFAALIAGVL